MTPDPPYRLKSISLYSIHYSILLYFTKKDNFHIGQISQPTQRVPITLITSFLFLAVNSSGQYNTTALFANEHCNEANNYGLSNNKPCIFIKMNKVSILWVGF